MPDTTRTLMVCSCEDTMPLDAAAIARGCKGADIRSARHLCRTQTELFTRALGESQAITVACTQEAPLFEEIAADLDYAGDLVFTNIRETGGWSREAKAAGPKMAALLAATSHLGKGSGRLSCVRLISSLTEWPTTLKALYEGSVMDTLLVIIYEAEGDSALAAAATNSSTK